MVESIKKKADRIVQNDLTWPRIVMVKFLTSYFRNNSEFNWSKDLTKTEIAIIDSRSDLEALHEEADRIIIQRQSFTGQTIIIDNKVKVNNEMFTHGIVKPRLGYLNIFCESRNDVHSEYLAICVENILMLHKDILMEMDLIIGETSLSDVREPFSGTGFYSILITVPTNIFGVAEFTIDKPEMISGVELELAVGSALNFQIGT